ncbi:hypothetical protein E2C06_35705 [Dankookia rubra]|uniref:Uncharacterized protein n=1 Tax=Dankookia rubra TaxID=1442381 RepID=A0A4V3A948_9PROT|nr:hypothetical protein [Dankookia rubra]TDH57855.1 hypothetical protein E2C06_35705 [Dankookia rubra]
MAALGPYLRCMRPPWHRHIAQLGALLALLSGGVKQLAFAVWLAALSSDQVPAPAITAPYMAFSAHQPDDCGRYNFEHRLGLVSIVGFGTHLSGKDDLLQHHNRLDKID